MVIEKTWAKQYEKVPDWYWTYRGWFLFGLIPLYIRRDGCFHKVTSLHVE